MKKKYAVAALAAALPLALLSPAAGAVSLDDGGTIFKHGKDSGFTTFTSPNDDMSIPAYKVGGTPLHVIYA